MTPRHDSLLREVAHALGSPVVASRRATGGDINDCLVVRLEDSRTAFIKTQEHPLPGMYAAEAEGLWALARSSSSTLRVPEVWAVRDDAEAAQRFLALSHLTEAHGDEHYEEQLGRGLAELHGAAQARYGWPDHNFIAVLPQDNTESDDWPSFYGERRLAPLLRRARERGALDATQARSIEALVPRLSDWLSTSDRPSLLHGDLWGGNAMATTRGPAIFDPAVYVGHREVDLAMMHLFGGFAARTFAAYEEAYPLAPGAEERRPLYQLYPLLVHVLLFGGHYATQAYRVAQRYTGG